MFTVADIRNIAIQIEKNGEEAYLHACSEAKNDDVARILARMAEEERAHAQWFGRITSSRPLTDEEQKIESMGASLLTDMIEGNTFLLDGKELAGMRTVAEVLGRARTFEEDTVVFYEFLLGLLDNAEAVEQLQRIIEEERNHIRQLAGIEDRSCRPPCLHRP
ncbi:MAG: ferritin family protein [Desulfocapsaceae bacterium]|nr:ferritin family protein [Desulfocapsaceae bacterium]